MQDGKPAVSGPHCAGGRADMEGRRRPALALAKRSIRMHGLTVLGVPAAPAARCAIVRRPGCYNLLGSGRGCRGHRRRGCRGCGRGAHLSPCEGKVYKVVLEALDVIELGVAGLLDHLGHCTAAESSHATTTSGPRV